MLSRNILRTSAALLRNAPKNVKVAPVAVQSFSTILEKKELAEETKYIRQLEERRREEIRHNLERILALEDSSKEKQDLVGLLGEFRPQFYFSSVLHSCPFLRQLKSLFQTSNIYS
jgi:hypothetical protein